MLDSFVPADDIEAKHLQDIRNLIAHHPDCYVRSHFLPGHITGSALLISHDHKRVLMNYHRSLQKWLCFGGHADGDRDILNVARREVVEESGIEKIKQVGRGIFDVDVHQIPENPNKGEPAHNHFDIRFLFCVTAPEYEEFVLSDESVSLQWCEAEEALSLIQTAGMRRLLNKWASQIAQNPQKSAVF